MTKSGWKLKDKEGNIYTPRHFSSLKRAYQDGKIADGDLFFQRDLNKPWMEIKDLKLFFRSFEKEDILTKEKVINKKVLKLRTYHMTLLLFILGVLVYVIANLILEGRAFPLILMEEFGVESKLAFIIGSLIVLTVLLFLPLTIFYTAVLNWIGKIKGYFTQEEKRQKGEVVSLKRIESLSDSLTTTLEKNGLIRSILNSAVKTSHLSSSFLLLHNYQRNRLLYESGLNIDKTFLKKTEYTFDEPPIKNIVRQKKIIWIDKISEKDDYFIRPEKMGELERPEGLVLIPLMVGEELLGILGLYGARESLMRFKQNYFLYSILERQASMALGSAIQFELAIIDRLTGLLNHEYFMRRLYEEIERSRRFNLTMSLLMIDLDYFKQINDSCGHQAGDEILKSTANIFQEKIRLVDFCGRYGGEEFAICLVDTDIEGAKIKAEQLRKAIEEKTFQFDKQELKITISIGLSIWKTPEYKDSSSQDLVKRADKELYRAKKEGRNRVCFIQDKHPKSPP